MTMNLVQFEVGDFNEIPDYEEYFLNDHLVLYKEYLSEARIKYLLFFNFSSMKYGEYPHIRKTKHYLEGLDNYLDIACIVFILRENNDFKFGSTEVHQNFRRLKIASFLYRHFLESYFPNNEYRNVSACVETEEGYRFCRKLGFVEHHSNGNDSKDIPMIIEYPKKLLIPKTADLSEITRNILAVGRENITKILRLLS